MLITRKAEFSASHICYNSALPEDVNRDLYGEGPGSHGHGHNYTIDVTLEGEPDPVTVPSNRSYSGCQPKRSLIRPYDGRH